MQFRLDEINKIKDYFLAQIWKREAMSKTIIKYITGFDYFVKTIGFPSSKW